MKESELDLMMKGYTEDERKEVLDKADKIDNLLKAMMDLVSSYSNDGKLIEVLNTKEVKH